MTNEDIKQLSTKDLNDKIVSEKEALNKLRVSHAVSAIENPIKIRDQRRAIARMVTELTKRQKTAKA